MAKVAAWLLLPGAGLLAAGCLLPRAELVDADGSGGGAGKGGNGGKASGAGGKATIAGRECDWDTESGRCDDKSCAALCPDPKQDGGYCLNSCRAVLECVSQNPDCVTTADPVCAQRNIVGQTNACTDVWEMAAGNPGSPAQAAARQLIECLCH